ncbi:MAG TPA: hypothetical protein VFC60_01505 [Tissierellaceae bacterium]|nr:hypothetical protein [Tissierellaceae bacterium]
MVKLIRRIRNNKIITVLLAFLGIALPLIMFGEESFFRFRITYPRFIQNINEFVYSLCSNDLISIFRILLIIMILSLIFIKNKIIKAIIVFVTLFPFLEVLWFGYHVNEWSLPKYIIEVLKELFFLN